MLLIENLLTLYILHCFIQPISRVCVYGVVRNAWFRNESQVWKGYAIVCLKPPRFLSAYWTPPAPPLQPPAQQTHEEIAEEACQRPVSLHFILEHMSNTIPRACAVSQHCENTQLRWQRTAISISTLSRLQTVMRHALLPVLPTNDAGCHMGEKSRNIGVKEKEKCDQWSFKISRCAFWNSKWPTLLGHKIMYPLYCCTGRQSKYLDKQYPPQAKMRPC